MKAHSLPETYVDHVKAIVQAVKHWMKDAPGEVAIRVNVPRGVHLAMTLQQAVHGGYIDMPVGLLDAVLATTKTDPRFKDPTPTMVRVAIDVAKNPDYKEA